MKKLILSILAVIFITVIIPLAIVELVPPHDNAASTEPQHAAGETEAFHIGTEQLICV